MTDELKHETATCRISVCTAIPQHMQGQTRELTKLHVPVEDRRKGYATALMHLACSQADQTNITLILWVNPFGDMDLSKTQLRDWYARFGFIEIQEDPCLMARMPGSTPRSLH